MKQTDRQTAGTGVEKRVYDQRTLMTTMRPMYRSTWSGPVPQSTREQQKTCRQMLRCTLTKENGQCSRRRRPNHSVRGHSICTTSPLRKISRRMQICGKWQRRSRSLIPSVSRQVLQDVHVAQSICRVATLLQSSFPESRLSVSPVPQQMQPALTPHEYSSRLSLSQHHPDIALPLDIS